MFFGGTALGYGLVVFDMDGVLVDCGSSWVVVHDHFGVNNEASLELYLEREIDDLEFMRRDIALWKRECKDLHISLIRDILKKVPLMPNLHQVFETLKEHGLKTAIVSGGSSAISRAEAVDAMMSAPDTSSLPCV